eukprot:GILJ01003323.1.p1 GENE.GILJ01003323.1~~GILJ01003323.1.p1  ORF type:complete len:663 (-),score=63.55 GILJ01003323.1:227-1957(-)
MDSLVPEGSSEVTKTGTVRFHDSQVENVSPFFGANEAGTAYHRTTRILSNIEDTNTKLLRKDSAPVLKSGTAIRLQLQTPWIVGAPEDVALRILQLGLSPRGRHVERKEHHSGRHRSTGHVRTASLKLGGSSVSTLVKPQKPLALRISIQHLVSRKKRRWLKDGFDLDLTYITDRLIAMGFPAEKMESFYRNSMKDVQRFFEQRHGGRYKVYNLCSERKYDHAKFNGRVAEYPFDDHNAPKLVQLIPFCQDVDDWLGQHPDNVAVVHCKAGKGRTGVMICAYLLYARLWDTAEDALAYYGFCRTSNQKGVTIPSQRRYVQYLEEMLHTGQLLRPLCILRIDKIVLTSVPRINRRGGCEPWFTVKNENMSYSWKKIHKIQSFRDESSIEFSCEALVVYDDVKLEFYHNALMGKEKMFQLWFHTSFVQNNYLEVPKAVIDKAFKDKACKKYDADFKVCIYFSSAEDEHYSRYLSDNPDSQRPLMATHEASSVFPGRVPLPASPAHAHGRTPIQFSPSKFRSESTHIRLASVDESGTTSSTAPTAPTAAGGDPSNSATDKQRPTLNVDAQLYTVRKLSV